MPPTSLTAQPRRPVSALQWALLAALVLAVFAARMWGIGHSLPHNKEADAHIALHTELLREGVTTPDPKNNDNQYPILLPGLLALTPSLEAPLAERKTLGDHLRAAGSIYRESRIEIALLSLLLIPLTFLLARSFVTNGWALFAATLSGASFLTHFFAQQARPHSAAASFFLLAVLCAMRLARKPTLANYALASAACALAIGVLHSGLATLPALLVAMLIAPLYVVHEPSAKLYRRLAAAPLVIASLVAVSFRLFYPYLFREKEATEFDKPMLKGTMLIWGDHRIALEDFLGRGFGVVLRTLLGYEPLLLALLVLASALWLLRKPAIYGDYERWSDKWVALAFALPYLVAIGLFARTFERFVIPLVPYFAVFAAWGLARVVELRPRWRLAVLGAAFAVTTTAARDLVGLSSLRAKPDSLTLAAQWLDAQPDAHQTRLYVAPQFDLPLARDAESLFPGDARPPGRFSRWAIYQTRLGADVVPGPRWNVRYLTPRPDLGYPFQVMESDPEGYVRALGPGYFVLDVSRQPARRVFTEFPQLMRRIAGEPVARFGPNEGGPNAGWSLPFEDEIVDGWPRVLPRVLKARCTGPVVEIFRVE